MRIYGQKCTVIFDDYPDLPTTKDEAYIRRAGSISTASVILREDILITSEGLHHEQSQHKAIHHVAE